MTAGIAPAVGRAGAGIPGSPTPVLSVAELQHAVRLTLAARATPPGLRPPEGRRPPVVIPATAGPSVAVMGAHPGAGCSTVTLLLADTAARTGRPVHVIDPAVPGRSGLAAATGTELGQPVPGWQRGRRGRIVIDRRTVTDTNGADGADGAGGVDAVDWPEPPADAGELTSLLTIIDGGTVADPATGGSSWPRLVLVCRATIPGVTQVERALAGLAELQRSAGADPIAPVVAAIGPRRWPGAVRAARGRLLTRLQERGRVVPVPVDRRLETTGLTSARLPRSLETAGTAVLALLAEPAPTPATPA